MQLERLVDTTSWQAKKFITSHMESFEDGTVFPVPRKTPYLQLPVTHGVNCRLQEISSEVSMPCHSNQIQ